MNITLNLNLLINVAMLVVAVIMVVLTFRKVSFLEKNHLKSQEEKFEEFKESFWKEFGAFRNACHTHQIEQAKIQSQMQTEVKNLKQDVAKLKNHEERR